MTASQPGPDDREPTLDRQAELRAAYEANVAAGRAPYAGVKIPTRGEVQWIMQERNWSGDTNARGTKRVNLSRASLVGVNLSRVYLVAADLSGADLRRANLNGAILVRADLSGARLFGANLCDATLRRTNLSGTGFFKADLSGADLRQARMDAATELPGITISQGTQFGDVVWNGAPLTQVDWGQVPRLGDEQEVKDAKDRRGRIAAYHAAARAYRGLSVALHDQGLTTYASDYRLREQRLGRAAQLREGKLGAWFFSGVLDLVAGHGERPGRIFVSYLVVVLAFAAAYLAVGLPSGLIPGPLDAIVFSLASFHGRGFFPNETVSLHDPLTVLAAAEAVVGLFIELTLIATFSRRFLGN